LPLTAGDSVANQRAERFAAVIELAARDPKSAIDSILVLRIDALAEAPAFAAALSDAAKEMRAGRGDAAAMALVRARRALAGQPTSRDSLARWGIIR
jgi:hypothetical protein